MADKTVITPKGGSVTDLPYSSAVICGNLVFVSGQVGINPETGNLISDDFDRQVEQVFTNLESILGTAGSGLEKVVKTTAFLTDMNDFPRLNDVYKQWFPKDRPARSCVQVSGLPFNSKVEIEAIAYT